MASADNNATVPITLTANAAAKVYSLICEEQNDQLKLRAFITGGGCSGFQYGFTFDEQIGDADQVVEKSITLQDVAELEKTQPAENAAETWVSIQLLVDPISFQYLKGAEIDYKIDVNGQQFVIRNPNAKTTCGCGASFAA